MKGTEYNIFFFQVDIFYSKPNSTRAHWGNYFTALIFRTKLNKFFSRSGFKVKKVVRNFYTVDSIKLARKLSGDITGRRCLNNGTFRKKKCFYKIANSGKQKEIYLLNWLKFFDMNFKFKYEAFFGFRLCVGFDSVPYLNIEYSFSLQCGSVFGSRSRFKSSRCHRSKGSIFYIFLYLFPNFYLFKLKIKEKFTHSYET